MNHAAAVMVGNDFIFGRDPADYSCAHPLTGGTLLGKYTKIKGTVLMTEQVDALLNQIVLALKQVA